MQNDEVKGDIDNNGSVTASDLVTIINYMLNKTDEINTSAADINGDGKFNILDVIHLKQLLMK